MTVVAVIQARMGSSRLPGKVMLPLGETHVLDHVVTRATKTENIDKVVVATSDKQKDDIIARFTPDFGAEIYRGSESNVLDRMYQAATKAGADTIVRITADCPLLDPLVTSSVVETLHQTEVDYVSCIGNRTFPRGLDAEAFTFESFERVHSEATEPRHREHVTPYYHENPQAFEIKNVESDMIYDEKRFQNRTDLRLTLDEVSDYELLRRLYTEIPYNNILPVRDVIDYIDSNGISHINSEVEQKTSDNTSSDQGE